MIRLTIAIFIQAMLLCSFLVVPAEAKPRTKRFEYKEGFERRPKDIVNTLKDNEVTRFQTMLEGLSQAYSLDNVLKGAGPFTLFAPSDRAWKNLPSEDRMRLFDNKKKLRQVLEYHVVKGKYGSGELRKASSLKTMEGHAIKIRDRFGDLWIDKAIVKTTDLPCSNGVIHVLDDVIMPPLSQ